jgi:hypothetical protein
MRPPLNCRASGFVQSPESHPIGGLVLVAEHRFCWPETGQIEWKEVVRPQAKGRSFLSGSRPRLAGLIRTAGALRAAFCCAPMASIRWCSPVSTPAASCCRPFATPAIWIIG